MFTNGFDVFSLRNVFTLICALLTLFLICQELVIFTVVKPTSTYKEETDLETTDLPEVVVCLDPGFDADVLKKYGYKNNKYYRGSLNGSGFEGWNGEGNGNISSQDILDEVLTFDRELQRSSERWTQIKGHHGKTMQPEVQFRTLAFPYGRCMSISPPSQKNATYPKLNSLGVQFPHHIKDTGLKMFFYGQSQLYPTISK